MTEKFTPNGLPTLIGSLPLGNHAEASDLVFEFTPEIPAWIQLPAYKEEGMMRQFLPGFPGLVMDENRAYIDASAVTFNDDMVLFYEEYMSVLEGQSNLDDSRFSLKPDTTKGFFVLTQRLKKQSVSPAAVKGQITGPITFCTGVKNQSNMAIFYDEQLRDVAVKLLAMKARWQVRQLKKFADTVILFFDEPALAGFGSSEFISISHEEVAACFAEVIEAVHEEGGLTGIHVCANADWSLLLDSSVDIVNFDAYFYFDKFALYNESIQKFLKSGKIIAWGIVPTLEPEAIEKETADGLTSQWIQKAETIQSADFDIKSILRQSLITPSCGMGSLSLEHTGKVLKLTRKVCENLREKYELNV